MTKICSKCKIEKDENEFEFRKDTNKYRNQCKECIKNYWKEQYQINPEKYKKKSKIWNKNNKERKKERNHQWYKNNFEHCKEISNKWRKEHLEDYKKYKKQYRIDNIDNIKEREKQWRVNNKKYKNELNKKWQKQKRRNDICFKIRTNVSRAITYYLKLNNGSKNNSSILKHLPYTINQLKQHLESQFDSNMSWENYGSYWHIDHIYPCSKLPFDSFDHPNFLKCWCLENLRPLEAIENIKKSNKLL